MSSSNYGPYGQMPQVRQFATETLTLSNGQTKSTAADIRFYPWVSIKFLTGFAGTSVTFEGSVDNSTFVPVYDENGVPVTLPVGTVPGGYLIPQACMSYGYLKVVSGTTQSPADSSLVVAKKA